MNYRCIKHRSKTNERHKSDTKHTRAFSSKTGKKILKRGNMITIPWKYFGPVEHRLIQCVNTPWLSANQGTTKQTKSSEKLTGEHPAIVYVNLCTALWSSYTRLGSLQQTLVSRTTYCWNNASALTKGQNQSSLFGFKRGFNCSQITSENSYE